ncbi:MAG: regulatory protein RecX [Clostridia bacterium]|nr:regulatory protein RecX [Clostridia bacterium]
MKKQALPDSIPQEYKKAVANAVNIMNYADNTERKLREKLARKGNNSDAVNYAVEFVKKQGILNDKRYLNHISERIANGKLYGKRRVIFELYTKGFRREDIEELDFDEMEVDFAENCAERIRKTKKQYSTNEKLKAALLRYGFSGDDIREAFYILKEEQKNND